MGFGRCLGSIFQNYESSLLLCRISEFSDTLSFAVGQGKPAARAPSHVLLWSTGRRERKEKAVDVSWCKSGKASC